MRTAIYVSKPTTITIRPSDATDRATIAAYNRQVVLPILLEGPIDLPRGIYLVYSHAPVFITGDDLQIETSLRDKDEWPEPPLAVQQLEKGASVKSIQAFFSISRDIDL